MLAKIEIFFGVSLFPLLTLSQINPVFAAGGNS
jgi:hypothetical protein